MQQARHLQGVSRLNSRCAIWGLGETACPFTSSLHEGSDRAADQCCNETSASVEASLVAGGPRAGAGNARGADD